VNSGTGRNYGIEFTLEKFFSRKYFLLLTGSVFDSKYRGSDGVLRNTDFNGNFATNLLSGAEYTVGRKKLTTLIAGGKLTWAGGRRYGPVDRAASDNPNTLDVVFLDAQRNSLQFRNYFRADLRLGFRRNTRRLTHEFAADLVNVLGVKNILSLTYAPDPRNPDENPIREEYQLGFLPLFYYKVDF
jgi:outer membrane receptor protein involved in Fe transport